MSRDHSQNTLTRGVLITRAVPLPVARAEAIFRFVSMMEETQ
jgi:hypothetical protein